MGEEAGQRVLLHGLHFAAQLGERFAADETQHLCVAPLAVKAAGQEAAFEDTALGDELAERVFNDSGIEAEALCGLAQGEGTMRAGVSADELEHWMLNALKECCGQSRRQRDAERIAIAGGVFSGDEALLAGDAEF